MVNKEIDYHRKCTKECCLVAVMNLANILNYPPCNKKRAWDKEQKLVLTGNTTKK